MSKFARLLRFLEDDEPTDDEQVSANLYEQRINAFQNVPIFSSAVSDFFESILPQKGPATNLTPQYGLMGVRQDASTKPPEDRLILANFNTPWSAFICGSQGAGKSHTLSCLLEGALLRNNDAGELPNPLAGMVLHYDNYSNYTTTQLCETAYLCSSGIPVKVLVSPSNIWAMKRLYNNLPGLHPDSPRPKVLPLYFTEHQLDISRILKLMAVDPVAKDVPLYMEVVMNIIREMAMEGTGFTYAGFHKRINEISWVRGQDMPLKMRMQLLDAFLAPSSLTKITKPAFADQDIWDFEPGSLTIVDLSDPFVSSDDACSLFSICISIFLEERSRCGRVLALDEAHKFLAQTGEARLLTSDLTSIIRQQRHTGTRVLIATQEPTLSPELIDLANATFVHRFLSPAWYEILKKHLAGANKQDSGSKNTLFDTIVTLGTGEALLFCPTAQVDIETSREGTEQVESLGNGYIKLKVRKRLTADGGRSILASDSSIHVTGPATADDVLMYIVPEKASGSGKSGAKNAAKTGLGPKAAKVPNINTTHGQDHSNAKANTSARYAKVKNKPCGS
ncbi:uncharacterized protein BCR38DRAFT_490676 [Pseudomassariella vexata]|uniref:P-loop containing nucleoside triphosphate hydrolase protein n=1 Tax=Pseudomassariella vexata TaxID=1141098 RepID=A0A1Y2DB80_9PEZI|nr:uncharacterized protein BCR38DRAFT_490676 [Pseudomassariella vexata]ORY56376.1 hypothetical protein BCR38DRAFT_490676 [Pseudomassariella vexata]